ncbi:MAG: ribosomal protein L16 Arg81 hydroxylase, partial [Gammaproteobacteria bacterium]
AGEEFCVAGQDRDGHASMLLSASKLEPLLARGATIILDTMESLSANVRELSNALQSALGGTVICNAYCSFATHAGFSSHFDSTDVYVLQIAGFKRWRIYEGRAIEPVQRLGHSFSSFSREHHESAKGPVGAEVTMTPGDVLYVPRGQYHDALAASEASLHLSFGITRATGGDFIGVLIDSLLDEPLFRREMAHFDDQHALAKQLQTIGARIAAMATADELPEQVVRWQRERVFRDIASPMQIPARVAQTRVRVRRGAGIEWDGQTLCVGGVAALLHGSDFAVIDWLMARELFFASELVSACGLDEPAALLTLERLRNTGLIEPL